MTTSNSTLTTIGVVVFGAALVMAAGSKNELLSEIALGITAGLLILMILRAWPRLAPILFKTGGKP